MKKLLIFLALCAIAVAPLRAADIIVPTTSDFNANGVALQSALNSAQCGDSVVLQAGATYDGTFFLSNKGCSTPITVKSANAAALPARVGPSDAANMARVRTLGGGSYGAVFQASAGAGFWSFDGLEITDNGPNSVIIHMLFDFSDASAHDMEIRRSYLHGKETGTNYYRSIRFGVQFEGSGLLMEGNHVSLAGYNQPELGYGPYYPIDTRALLTVGGNTLTLRNNFLDAWYTSVFTGGGDTAPQNSATLTNATMSSANFSNVTGITPGMIVRIGANKTVQVSSVAGDLVSYAPFGIDAITEPGTQAFWNYGDQGLVYDLSILGNTFYIDPAFAIDVKTNNGNHPKGYFEIKNAKRMTVDGNYFLGYPAVLGFTASNQNATAPWTTTSDLVIRNNWLAPDPAYATARREAIIIADNQYIRSVTPSSNVDISNNFMTMVQNIVSLGAIQSVSIKHNTVLNIVGGEAYNSIMLANGVNPDFQFKDNIISYMLYGVQCYVSPNTQEACYPSGTFSSNAVVDNWGAGVSTSQWGAGSVLSPVVPDFAAVGFTDAANGDYRLLSSSIFKGMASDATDPGVDMDALLAALGGAVEPPDPPDPPDPPADTQAPFLAVSVTPTGNKGVIVFADATDNVGVTHVDFYVDGILKLADTAAPYSYSFNVPGKPHSQHPVAVIAYDAAGNSTSVTVFVSR